MDSKQLPLARRFFKVIMSGFHKKLNLPPVVCKELDGCNSKKVILESCVGKWEIGMRINRENDLICLKQGWPEFIRRHSLTIGDFLVFEPTAQPLHLKVYVFNPSACEKEFSVETKKPSTAAPYFSKTMVPTCATHAAKVNIPTEFMRSNNLGTQKRVCLRDPRGRAWKVKLTITNNGLWLRMHAGWREFYVSNALKNGDTCVFNLIRPKTTRTTIFFDVNIIRTTK